VNGKGGRCDNQRKQKVTQIWLKKTNRSNGTALDGDNWDIDGDSGDGGNSGNNC